MPVNDSIMYNMTKLEEVGTPEQFLVTINNYTGGTLVILMLIAIFIISYVAMKSYLASKAALGAMTVTTIFSLIFMGIGAVPLEVPLILMAITMALIFWVRNSA